MNTFYPESQKQWREWLNKNHSKERVLRLKAESYYSISTDE
jgi:hypothetical protein